MIRPTLTAEEFVQARRELADGGRWSELVAGETVSLHPPSDKHGPVVLNISKALAEYQEHTREGYACFELGLLVERDPDSVLCPAISYFVTGDRWEELDKAMTEARPALVVELASTPDRRRNLAKKAQQYLAWGVVVVWIIDPETETVVIWQNGRGATNLANPSSIEGDSTWKNETFQTPILASFSVSLASVFFEREW
jgi:Uma2 family endonuclease